MKVCVLGDTGLLGQALIKKVAPRHETLGVSRKPSGVCRISRYRHISFDLTKSTDKFFTELKKFKAELLVNCAGLADVKKCEALREEARFLNADLPGRLAEFAFRDGMAFIHLSTDHIFDGRKKSPYLETDKPNPLNRYGATKLRGEQNVAAKNPKALIVRTNVVGLRGSEGNPTFVEWLLQALLKNETIVLAEDFVTSSIHADFLAELLLEVHQKKLSGILNLASSDSVSKYAFGKMLAKKLAIGFKHVKKGKLKDLNLIPPRPAHLALDTTRAQKLLPVRIPAIQDTLQRLAEECSAAR